VRYSQSIASITTAVGCRMYSFIRRFCSMFQVLVRTETSSSRCLFRWVSL